MADYTYEDRFQPCLIDRLVDDDPTNQSERRDAFVMSMTEYRQAVLRDLAWLLNTTNLSVVEDLEEYPDVQSSVLNYGVPNLSGMVSSQVDLKELEKKLSEALNRFEPRILEHGLQVRIVRKQDEADHNIISLSIEGQLWADPVPEELLVQTQLDVETGQCVVQERRHG